MSWTRMQPNQLTYFVSDLVDPYLNLIKRFIPSFGMIDISPIVALYLLGFIEQILLSFL